MPYFEQQRKAGKLKMVENESSKVEFDEKGKRCGYAFYKSPRSDISFEGTCLDEYPAPAGRRLILFNHFSIEFLDFKRGVKLFWTNKAIVINNKLIEFIKSGDVVCCHDCLFQAD